MPLNALSPHIRESKTVLDSGFHAVDSRFQVLDSSLCQWNLDSGFQSLEEFRIPLAHFPSFLIPRAKISCIPESGIPYMVQALNVHVSPT